MITSGGSDREFAAVSATRARRADQVCDCFEAAWRGGRRPQIEVFLDDASEPTRSLLLRELVGLEVVYRRMRGESPRLSEYRARFPDRELVWLTHAMDGVVDLTDDPITLPPSTVAAGAGVQKGEISCGPGGHQVLSTCSGSRTRTLGKFHLIERVGVGAFGSVWRAQDLQLGRVVAVKIPHTELIETARDLERIYHEARTVAQLRHPGIVTVHEVLVHEGLPILVSDFVAGTTLRDLLATRRLTQREAALVVAKVAEALGYAHALGAIHRDIKPANIMIDDESSPAVATPGNAPLPDSGARPLGEPRVVDFGLAFREQDSMHLTQAGQLVGTPAYMSPQQAGDGPDALDGRADVYSLGVVLYETLTGDPPFTGTRSEILRQLAHDEPRRLRQIDRTISRDLETICHKAMAKDVRERYLTARDLADDIKRYLDGEPIRARPVGMWEWIWRQARRRPAEAAVLAMLAVTALAFVGLGVGWRFHLRLLREYRRTDQARQSEASERRRAETYLYYNRMALAEREYSANNVERVERLLDDCPRGLRGWEWSYLKRQCHHELLTIPHASSLDQSVTVTHVVFSPDGRQLATSCRDGMVRLWDAATGSLIRVVGRHDSAALAVAYHPDGSQLASSGQDGLVKVWEPATGRLLRVLRCHGQAVYCTAYSPDGRLLASGDGFPPWESVLHLRTPGVVKIWDAVTGDERAALNGHAQNVMGVAFSPDGSRLATVSGAVLAVPQVESRPGELLVWDVQSRALMREISGHDGPLTAVAYSPDGQTVATSSWDRTVKLWDPQTGARRATLAGHQDWVCHVAFDPSGSRLATAGADGAVHLWDIHTGRVLLTYRGHTQNVTCVAFDPNGGRVASSGSDQTVKLWDSSAGHEAFIWRGRGPVVRLAFFPDGRRLVLGGSSEADDGRIRPRLAILEPSTRRVVELARDDSARDNCINGVAVSSDGAMIAACMADHKTEVRDAATGALLHTFAVEQFESLAAAFSPDRATLAIAGMAPPDSRDDGSGTRQSFGYLALWDLATGTSRWARSNTDPGPIRSVAFSPDGHRIATADNDGTVTLRDAARGEPIRQLSGHRRLVTSVAFSPDGRRLASASWDQTVRVWDCATGHAIVTLRGHMRSVLCLAFSPDGTRLATGSEDQTVKLWDVETGEEVLTLRGHAGVVSSVAFSRDGRRLASAGSDGAVQIREAEPLFSRSSDSPSN